MKQVDVIIIGAGAAGLLCAIAAGRRGRSVLVLDHANKVGKKILMSGGGRCNFTNLHSTPDNFISRNPHFCKSALARFTPQDFVALVEKHGVAYHEKAPGQLFCDHSAKDIVNLLLAECAAVNAQVQTRVTVEQVETGAPHRLVTSAGELQCESLVIATGGLSIPTMGATGFGYEFATRLGLEVLPTRAGLVPFTLDERRKRDFGDLAGVSVEAEVCANGAAFRENILFTHRGLSGPAVLQVSSYWQPGEAVAIDLFPGHALPGLLAAARQETPKQLVKTFLARYWPRRMAERWCEVFLPDGLGICPLAELANTQIEAIVKACQPWSLRPAGTEGYRTAEVTLGGVDTGALSSRTLECRDHPGVFFIGEVVDVTGHLGGHNFQWAWASGHAAGQAV